MNEQKINPTAQCYKNLNDSNQLSNKWTMACQAWYQPQAV